MREDGKTRSFLWTSCISVACIQFCDEAARTVTALPARTGVAMRPLSERTPNEVGSQLSAPSPHSSEVKATARWYSNFLSKLHSLFTRSLDSAPWCHMILVLCVTLPARTLPSHTAMA